MQLDLNLADKTCGGCVHRNAWSTDEVGYCTPGDEYRRKDEPACEQWFGREQLIAATTRKRRAA